MADLQKLFGQDVPDGDAVHYPEVLGNVDLEKSGDALSKVLVSIMSNGIRISREGTIIDRVRCEIESNVLRDIFNKRNITDIGFDKISADLFDRGCELDTNYIDITSGVKESIGMSCIEGQEGLYEVRVKKYFQDKDLITCLQRLAELHMDELISFGRGEIRLGKKI